MTKLQKFKDFIKQHGVDQLSKQLSITINERGGLRSLSYSQTKSPTHNDVVANCRGTIIDENDNIVALPFERFHNLVKTNDIQVGAVAANKLDGSLIIMYHHNGRWNFASSGQPDLRKGLITINGRQGSLFELIDQYITCTQEPTVFDQRPENINEWQGEQFFTLIDEEWYETRLNAINKLLSERLNDYTDYTFMFELNSPYNKVVVRYEQIHLDIIGMRNRVTGDDVRIDLVEQFILENGIHFNIVQNKPINPDQIDDYITELEDEYGDMVEGLVITNPDGTRFKYKTKKFVAAHHTKWDKETQTAYLRKKDIAALIIANEQEEFLAYFPEYTEQFNEALAIVQKHEEELRKWFKFACELKDNQSGLFHNVPRPYSNAFYNAHVEDDSEESFQKVLQTLKPLVLKKYK